jgi:dTDP-4-amino-4,6-dideoxygalactose transaminase
MDLNAQHEPLRKDFLSAMERVLNQNNFIRGYEVNELEQRVAAYSRTSYVCGDGLWN